MNIDQAESGATFAARSLAAQENGVAVVTHCLSVPKVIFWTGDMYRLAQLQSNLDWLLRDRAQSAFYVVNVGCWNEEEYDYSCADGAPRLAVPGYYDMDIVKDYPYDVPVVSTTETQSWPEDVSPF